MCFCSHRLCVWFVFICALIRIQPQLFLSLELSRSQMGLCSRRLLQVAAVMISDFEACLCWHLQAQVAIQAVLHSPLLAGKRSAVLSFPRLACAVPLPIVEWCIPLPVAASALNVCIAITIALLLMPLIAWIPVVLVSKAGVSVHPDADAHNSTRCTGMNAAHGWRHYQQC